MSCAMRPFRKLLAAWLAMPAISAALPVVQLPSVPHLPLPVDLNRTLSDVTGRLDSVPRADLRRLRVRELLRTQRKFVEADPQGAPMVRAEVLAYSPSQSALDAASAAGFAVVRQRTLAGLEATVVVLRAPPHVSTRRALAQVRKLDPAGEYDFNHIYMESGDVGGQDAAPRHSSPISHPADGVKIGLVDGGVDTSHSVFEHAVVHQHGCDDKPVPSPHGTAVASLIAGQAGKFHGAAPGAELYAADIYCDRPTGGAMDDIADAIAWIVSQHVAVINVSLVGPRNLMLQKVVQAAIARGHIIVAAVGNDGPAAPPLYPASYPDVVGVTAVDSQQRVLLESCRGPQVDFAAPGADMAAAVPTQSYAPVRGTSFAAPLVASLLAEQLQEPDKTAAAQAIAQLTQQAVDLGARGPDETYGQGLVGNALRTDPSLAAASDK